MIRGSISEALTSYKRQVLALECKEKAVTSHLLAGKSEGLYFLKGIFTQKSKLFHPLLTLMGFQTCMTFLCGTQEKIF